MTVYGFSVVAIAALATWLMAIIVMSFIQVVFCRRCGHQYNDTHCPNCGTVRHD